MVMNYSLYVIEKLPFTPIQAYYQGIVMTFLIVYLNKNNQ